MPGPQPEPLNALLDRAVDHLSRGETAPAEQLIVDVLSRDPHQYNAMQLLGTLRSMQNRPQEAEQLYVRSLQLNRNQPLVLVNIGHLMRPQGRHAAAAVAYREAIRLQPNYAAAHFNLASVLHEVGALDEAERSYRQTLRVEPQNLNALIGLGAVLNDQKRFSEAEKILQPLSGKIEAPDLLAALEHNLGMARAGQSDLTGALVHYEKALAHAPHYFAAEHSRADALNALGREQEAVEAFRRAIALNPQDFGAHRDLNQLLYRLKRDDEFLKSYDEAAQKAPDVVQLPIAKASFLLNQDRPEEAREIFERIVARTPNSVEALNGLGVANLKLKRFDASIAAYEKALALAPGISTLVTGLAATLLSAGDAKKAAMMAEHALGASPTDQAALAILGSAWRMAGDEREFSLNGYEKFIRAYDLEPPAGYSDMGAFNRDLNAYLDTLHPDVREYIDQSLRNGTQTLGNIFEGKHDLVDRLKARIAEAVDRYIRDMATDAKHPLLSRRTDSFKFAGSWSSRLRDCGFHTNHFHPEGWISSAYYVALPETVADADSRSGWIKFGESGYEQGIGDPVRRAVQPQPGRLVLFPSYMWHGTVPFRSAKTRTTIAFDVVPTKA